MLGLQPQDLVLAIYIVTNDDAWTFQSVSQVLGISPSQVHAAWKRLVAAKLADSEFKRVIKKNLLEFLCHGAKYCFPAQLEGQGVGMPTSHSHSRIRQLLVGGDGEIYIWPDAQGKSKGIVLLPVHKSALQLAKSNKNAYAILAAVDLLRTGKPREQEAAVSVIRDFFK